ncbi:four helix bundle protein [Mucilaginibacter roseus]|uniref:Four helix bundle protein n=1 Tax=Mucilaginibacter roseus TaxID=1528868 RepID=A0ABS8U5Z1_9SPHI|nr:four helix bundle protein [Mucilaginibacter roseus]MCD8740918.1 four helix bundle protein [Mucilaginibacter roseus]
MKIWQRSMDLVDLVYDYTDDLPFTERYNLISQTNRAACSIPSNIAEGSGKRTNVHFGEFLTTSLTSSYELETQFLICKRRLYGNVDKLENCLSQLAEVQKMIFSFREYILNNDNPE